MLEGRLLADAEFIQGSSALFDQAERLYQSDEVTQAAAKVFRGEAKDAIVERPGHRFVFHPRPLGATTYNVSHSDLKDTPDGVVLDNPISLVFARNRVTAYTGYDTGINGMSKGESLYLAQDIMKVLEK